MLETIRNPEKPHGKSPPKGSAETGWIMNSGLKATITTANNRVGPRHPGDGFTRGMTTPLAEREVFFTFEPQ